MKSTFYPTRLAIVAVMGLILLSGTIGNASSEVPAETINHLLTLRHGLYRLAPEDRERLALVKADPAPYLAAIKSHYPTAKVVTLLERSEQQQFERACLLLGEIKTPAAGDQLAAWYIALSDASAQSTRTRDREQLGSLQHVTLEALNDIKRDEVVKRITDSLERMDPTQQLSSLRYLLRSSANVADVRIKLRTMFEDRRSPLFHDKVLESVLNKMKEH